MREMALGGRSGASFTGEAWERPHCVAHCRGSELCSPTGEGQPCFRPGFAEGSTARGGSCASFLVLPYESGTVCFSPGLWTGVIGLSPTPSHPRCACFQPARALELGRGAHSQPWILRAWCCILQRLSVNSSGGRLCAWGQQR